MFFVTSMGRDAKKGFFLILRQEILKVIRLWQFYKLRIGEGLASTIY